MTSSYRALRTLQTSVALYIVHPHFADDVVLLVVDEADVGLSMPPFAADKEGYVLASASDAMTFDVAETFDELDGEITNCRLFCSRRRHGKVEEVDEFGVAIRNHVFRILCGEEFAIDGWRRQVVCSEESSGVLELRSNVVRVQIVHGPVTARLGQPDKLSHRGRGIKSARRLAVRAKSE